MMKILAEKRGPLQGMTVKDILQQAYGDDVELVIGDTWGSYAGVIVRPRTIFDDGDKTYDILDMVLEVHEASVL